MADNNIVPILGDVRIDRLTKTQIEKWQAGLVRDDDPNDPDARRRSQDSTNRLLTILKAALNGAFADEANGIATDAAWRRVKAFRNVGRAREDDLAPADARALIAKAKRIDASLATLIEAGYLTGARPGELRDLNVGDLDGATLRIRDGKTGRRLVTLNAECAAFLKRAAGNRAADAPLLPTLNGQRWDLHDAHRPLKAALDAAGLPDTVSLYTARHAHISRSIEAGMPLSLIAENCGTSLTMIERNYAKVLAHTRRDTVERTAPKLRGKA
jgi:integrase